MPVCNEILPPEIDAALAPVEPVTVSIASSRSCTVPVVLMVPPLAVVLVGLVLLKVRVLPSTVSVSPLAKAVESTPLPPAGAPESAVAVVRFAVVAAARRGVGDVAAGETERRENGAGVRSAEGEVATCGGGGQGNVTAAVDRGGTGTAAGPGSDVR